MLQRIRWVLFGIIACTSYTLLMAFQPDFGDHVPRVHRTFRPVSPLIIEHYSQEFIKAAKNRDLARVRSFLSPEFEELIDVNAHDTDDVFPAIGFSAARGYDEIVETLLADSRTDPNKPGLLGQSALLLAIVNGQKSTIRLLLNCPDINVNAQNVSGQTSTMIAICLRDDQTLYALLQRPETDVNIQDRNGLTPLMHAVVKENRPAVEMILQSGKPIALMLRNVEGKTALDLATPESTIWHAMTNYQQNV